MKTKLLIATAFCALAITTSCVPFEGQTNTYKADDIGETRDVQSGTITSIENITIEADNRDYGTALGAGAGALAGNTLGGGTGRTLFTAGGLLAGALAGNQLDKQINREAGVKVMVKLDNNKGYKSITQRNDPNRPLYVGQPVLVEIGYKGSRVIPR